MKLSRSVTYAVQATLQLARSEHEGPVPCSRLAAEGHMPERFLLQILRSLVNHGILHSTRGVDGGYALERAPGDISLLDVIEAVEGRVAPSMPESGGPANRTERQLQAALQEVADAAREQLEHVKLSQFLLPKPPG